VPETKKPRLFYGYVIVIACFIITGVIIGAHSTFGVFLSSLLSEFGWTRAVTSGAYSLTLVLEGVVGLFVGRFTDKLGPRLVLVACGIFLGLGYLLTSQVNALWQLYFFLGVLTGIGQSGCIIPLVSTVARWFVKKRGTMTGIVLSGFSIGTMIIPPLTGRIITVYDWRIAYIAVGLIVLVFVIVAAQFLRRDPSKKGLSPYGANGIAEETLNLQNQGFTLKQATRTKQLWLVCIMYFLNLFTQIGILVHIVIHISGLGFSSLAAANTMIVIGGAGFAGSILVGNIADRIGNKRSLIITFIVMALTVFGLIAAKEIWTLYLIIAIWSFVAVGQLVLYSPIIAELFGLRAHGAIFSVVALIGTLGGAAGPVVLGHIFDITVSYQLAFLLCALISIAGFILALLIKPVTYNSTG